MELMTKLGETFGKVGFELKKHSPQIMVVGGVVGVVTSTVLACQATRKVDAVINTAKKDIKAIHDYDEEMANNPDVYTEKEKQKDLTTAYLKAGVSIAKLYLPAVLLGSLSITGILVSNKVLRKRNAALVAAYTTLDRGFKAYRQRVIEKYGEEEDRNLRYNIKAVKVKEKEVGEDGKETTVSKKVDVIDNIDECSTYARIFDENSQDWQHNFEYNMAFLTMQESYMNDKLKARGHLFLNEVYDALDIPRSEAGQIVGWIDDDKTGDGYVDFGISEVRVARSHDEKAEYQEAILLDFNVDGPILQTVKKGEK